MNEPIERRPVSDEPLYTIGAVSRKTSIAIATLRAWERRYGFPQSSRTAGGHRLYSERDVACLRWVKEQLDHGMQISQAVHALECREEAGQELSTGVVQALEGYTSLPGLRDQLVQALARHDMERADQVLGESLLVHDIDDLILDVIGPALNEIGQAWEEGQIDVAAEHSATNYLRHHLTMWTYNNPPPYQARPVALACAPDELHEGSLLILSTLLRRRRWPVAYLGQAVPLPDLANFVREVKPQVVVLVAMTDGPAKALTEWPRWLPEVFRTGQPVITYAGLAFNEQPQLLLQMPGTFLGITLREGIQKLESMLQPNP